MFIQMESDQQLKLLMFDLDPEVCEKFFHPVGSTNSARTKEVRRSTGLDKLFRGVRLRLRPILFFGRKNIQSPLRWDSSLHHVHRSPFGGGEYSNNLDPFQTTESPTLVFHMASHSTLYCIF